MITPIKRYIILLLGIILFFSCHTEKSHNTMKDVDYRIDSLLEQMTLDEKIGQMNQLMNFIDSMPIDPYFHNLIKEGKLGAVLNAFSPEMINEMQRIAIEESRLGIPLLVGRDVIHGYRTIFPVNIGLAATFNPDLVRETAKIAA
ncbi:MAG: glycosyl hydrolase, partial [Marinilabiliales bacterium]